MNIRDLTPEQLQHELKSNQRLRVGVWLIGLLLLSWLSLLWSDYNSVGMAELKRVQRDRAALADIESVEVWKARLAEMQARQADAGALLGRAATESLAMARLQSQLNQLIVKDPFITLSVRIGTPQLLESIDVHRIRAKVRVNLTAEQLLQTLQGLQASKQLLDTEQLELNFVKNRWVVDMTVAAYFEIGEAA